MDDCRDRLYGEILKKKKEMQRLIKEKEAWRAAAPTRADTQHSSRKSYEHQAAANGASNGRQNVPGHHRR